MKISDNVSLTSLSHEASKVSTKCEACDQQNQGCIIGLHGLTTPVTMSDVSVCSLLDTVLMLTFKTSSGQVTAEAA